MMSVATTAGSAPWYRTLNRNQWKALVASNLGWTFDGFEVFSLILTVGVALHQLVDPSDYKLIPALCGGSHRDYGFRVGRWWAARRYPCRLYRPQAIDDADDPRLFGLTGLSALSWSWLSFAVFRFLVGLAIGSEWATGASITAELWPDNARGKGGALLQCGYPIGSILASGVWLAIGSSGPSAWRYMYLVGVLPALLVFWIRRNMPESPRWEESTQAPPRGLRFASTGRSAARRRQRTGPLHAGRYVRRTRRTHAFDPDFYHVALGDGRLLGRFEFRTELRRSSRRRCRARCATLGGDWPAWCRMSAHCSASPASGSWPIGSAASQRRCCFI